MLHLITCHGRIMPRLAELLLFIYLFIFLLFMCNSWPRWLSWMRRSTGDQEVVGSTPRRGRQHSFVEIDHEIFSMVILSLPLIQEG